MDKHLRHSQAQTTRLPLDVDQELLALWPTLPARERALWLRILSALLPPTAPVLERLEQQEGMRMPEELTPQEGLYTRNQGAIQLLESWIAEDAEMSPAEQQAALTEWAQLERLLDEEYLADSPLQQ